MKKLTLASISIMLTLFASAQTYKLASESVNTKAIAEDPHNPLVNGIPYNQYKAQQDALKYNQHAAKISITGSPASPQGHPEAKTTPVVNNVAPNGIFIESKPEPKVDLSNTSVGKQTVKPAPQLKAPVSESPSSTDAPAAKRTEIKPQGGSN